MPLDIHKLQSASARIDVSCKLCDDAEAGVVHIDQAIVTPDHPLRHETVSINVQSTKHPEGGYILSFCITARKAIEFVQLEAKYNFDVGGQRMLANGFQSWSQAREMGADDRIPAIRQTVSKMTQYNLQGDYDFFPHSGERGHIHSSSYTHFRDAQNNIQFMGSLSEQHGYTYFKANFDNNTLSIYKDIKGKRMDPNTSIELIRVFMVEGQDEAHMWDLYANFFHDQRALKGDTHLRHVNGWTSWYNYYGDVSESIVLENLDALQKFKYPINIFQIDDGFQAAIGDWLSINNKFSSDLSFLTEKIRAAGYTPGLWLAPYAVGRTSRLATDHPDWLVKDPETGESVLAGPNWGGFFALDIYNLEARKYLKNVFDTVLHKWGFGMVKLDFLFAAAMIPRNGKSRGEIMWDAMQFARELTGSDKLLLGCGVPLAYAWRTADYCRIGSDVAPWWEGEKSNKKDTTKTSISDNCL
ncbi:glycoside hydrolase superfamily [Dichotomocladium elegans]|nr:glycoside hydrolase superfamily [Dichotomocladium elegans]